MKLGFRIVFADNISSGGSKAIIIIPLPGSNRNKNPMGKVLLILRRDPAQVKDN